MATTKKTQKTFAKPFSRKTELHKASELDKQREEAKTKYGDKQNDCIAAAYRESDEIGNWYCTLNIKKYLERYSRKGSVKQGNLVDLIKAKDYLERMIEHEENKLV